MLLALLMTANAADVTFTYNGRLLDTQGLPLEGVQTLQFRIHNADPVPGTQQWSESYTVDVEAGYFSVELGNASGTPLSDSVLATRPVSVQTLVGGVSLGSQTLMDVPYAASVPPSAVTTALATAQCTGDGTMGWDQNTGTLRICDGGSLLGVTRFEHVRPTMVPRHRTGVDRQHKSGQQLSRRSHLRPRDAVSTTNRGTTG